MVLSWLCNVRMGVQMSELGCKEEFVMKSSNYHPTQQGIRKCWHSSTPANTNCITEWIIFQTKCTHCWGKGISVFSWNTMSTTKTVIVHLVSVNLQGHTVTWSASFIMRPFLTFAADSAAVKKFNFPKLAQNNVGFFLLPNTTIYQDVLWWRKKRKKFKNEILNWLSVLVRFEK